MLKFMKNAQFQNLSWTLNTYENLIFFYNEIVRMFLWQSSNGLVNVNQCKYHRNQSINRKWTYILADIHGMEHFLHETSATTL
jgi:hypothetical protein